ncbi:MAG: porin [Acidobacteriota bacterium]
MKRLMTLMWLISIALHTQAQQSDEKLRELERKLDQASGHVEQLASVIESLRAEIASLKSEKSAARKSPAKKNEKSDEEFIERIIEPELGLSERQHAMEAKPEIFIQTRYSAAPIRDSASEFEPNISLTRIETRWAGKVNERMGAGLEIQFHPALDGSPEELVNDAFIEYYLGNHTAIRAGQFIKPFGFDIQQSSSARESPERGIFAGYFFPGQRDRGVMLSGDLDFLDNKAFRNIHYFLGAFNGNRFFADNNRQMNFAARVRKLFESPRLAVGFSLQSGRQPLPEGGNDDENLIGLDVQYAVGRLGLRGEFAAGNMPSTLLSIEPEFAPAFRRGAHSSGGEIFATYRLSQRDNIYARYDQFNNDPVTGKNVRAFNLGYFRSIGGMSRLSFDYQFKNRPSSNDDALNGRFHITWDIEFQ